MLFWMLCGVDTLVALVAFGFFLVGLADGSVSSLNMALWLQILALPTAILGGGLWLRATGRRKAATVVLLLLAVPAVLCTLFFGLLIVSQPHWN